MSHFSVLVIGDDPVKLLAPYHEFECTGEDDEYVQDVDRTEELREAYEEDTDTMLVSPEGERVNYYDECFYTKEPTPEQRERGLTDKGREDPEGWEEVEIPVRELKTFTDFVLDDEDTVDGERPYLLRPGQERTEAHKYRFVELDENDEVVRVVKRTNPNSHWDGWLLGGRFSRFFKLKVDAEFDIDNVGGGDLYSKDSWIHKGLPGGDEYAANPHTIAERKKWVATLTEAHSTDHARVKDIDFGAGRDKAEADARALFAKWREIYEKHGKPLPWGHFQELEAVAVAKLEEQGIADEEVDSLYAHHKHKVSRRAQERERAQQNFNAQPAMKAAGDAHLSGFRSTPIDMFGYDEDAYAEKRRDKAMIPYAVIKDGEWFAKGEMGWFACSGDHMTDEEWGEKVHKLYAELSPETLLTLVDCHV